MKKMMMAFIAAMMSASVMAQDVEKSASERKQFDKTEMLKKRTDETVKQLGLNEEQAAKLLELNTKYADKFHPGANMRHGQRPGRPGGMRPMNGQRPMHRPDSVANNGRVRDLMPMREDMREARDAYETELKTILTEEQFKVYQTQRRERMMQRPTRGMREARPERKAEVRTQE